jgi:hypothetical protein
MAAQTQPTVARTRNRRGLPLMSVPPSGVFPQSVYVPARVWDHPYVGRYLADEQRDAPGEGRSTSNPRLDQRAG